MAYTLEQVYSLEQAIASGATTVHYEDKSVTYRSLAEMKEILATMKSDILEQETGVKRRRTVRTIVSPDKGL